MALNKSLMSSKRDSWNTPECVLELVRKVGTIALDPCGNDDSFVGAVRTYTEIDNGLEQTWNTNCSGLIYVNPPYGRTIGKWVERCCRAGYNEEVIALLPARTDARWFYNAWESSALCFWRGRLRFLGAPSSAPFPSVVCYWGPRKYRFADVFSEVGRVVMP